MLDDDIIFNSKNKVESTEAEIVDNYFLDTLYTHLFKNGEGKFFTVVSSDQNDTPEVVDIEHPYPTRNKIKTTLTFIKDKNEIQKISFKRYKFYKKEHWVHQYDQEMVFSYVLFKQIIGFLQSFSKLDLNNINERRINLADDSGLDLETIKKVNTLLMKQDGQQLIKELINSGGITSVDIVNIGYRKAQLAIFAKLLNEDSFFETYKIEQQIKKEGREAVWQYFFEHNDWIFGYGLNFLFNKPLEGKKLEQIVQGHDVSSSGKRADGILKSSGVISSLCLLEIKTSKTPLLKQVVSPYRTDCWQMSDEFNGALAQSQKTVQKTIENIKISPELRIYKPDGEPTSEIIYTFKPKSYLIIGSLEEFNGEKGCNVEKFSSFDLLRKNLISPEVITFDELYNRAKFIVDYAQKNTES